MTYPPLADPIDLIARVGSVSDDDTPRLHAALSDASALVRAEVGQTYVDDDDELEAVPDPVVAVVLAVARRAFLNPSGVVSETTGPFSVRYTDEAGQGLYLTATERELLARYRTTPTPALWTLPTTRTELVTDISNEFDVDTDTAEDLLGPVPTREPW